MSAEPPPYVPLCASDVQRATARLHLYRSEANHALVMAGEFNTAAPERVVTPDVLDWENMPALGDSSSEEE
jgi:hypothetical protein